MESHSKLWLSSLFVFGLLLGSFATICALANPTAATAKQMKFTKKHLKIGPSQILVELADTDPKQEIGLMYRENLKPNEGMLFIFEEEQPRSFWMKNTFIDLDIGFFDKKKKLIDIQTMKAASSVIDNNLPSYYSTGPAQYALEVPKGWFKKNKIKIGATFKIN